MSYVDYVRICLMLTTYMSKTIFQRLGFIYVTSKFLQQHGRTESHFAPNLVMRIQFGLQTACILHMFTSGYRDFL